MEVVERVSSSRDADPTGVIFQRGVVYRGLYFPSLSNSFRLAPLEAAYQRYSQRQRQKSLIVVNCESHLIISKPFSVFIITIVTSFRLHSIRPNI